MANAWIDLEDAVVALLDQGADIDSIKNEVDKFYEDWQVDNQEGEGE